MVKQNLSDQRGIASIIVTLFLMIIMSLIVLGFARITRRELRQSLDRQLLQQAHYAAESGIHDAQDYINQQLATGPFTTRIDKCGDFTALSGKNSNINSSTNTSYSCVLIDPTPTDLRWTEVSAAGAGLVFPVKPESGTLDSITVSWELPDSNVAVPAPTYTGCSSPNFPPVGSWTCDAGILRVDITPMSSLDRNTLISKTINLVLYPAKAPSGSSTVNYGTLPGTHGSIISVTCSPNATTEDCSLKLDGITGLAGPEGYYMRIRPLYRSAMIKVNGTSTTSGGANAKLEGAQIVVDSTGKANDVLKRIQARVPVNATAAKTPSDTRFYFAINSLNSLCKVYGIIPGTPSTVSNNATIIDDSCKQPIP